MESILKTSDHEDGEIAENDVGSDKEEDIFEDGLHEYLTYFLGQTYSLSQNIRDAYLARQERFETLPIRSAGQSQQQT